MIRTITILLLVFIGFTNVKSQTSGGPDAFGYTWRNSNNVAGPLYTWHDITVMPGAVQVTGLSDDNTVGPFLLPSGMNLHYYWYDIDKFWIGSNGYVIFTNGQVSSPYPDMPSTSLPNDIVAAMMSDLTFTDLSAAPVPGASCWYWANAANDTLIVTWKNVPFWQAALPGYTTGNNSFQIVFANADSSITYNYLQQNGTTNLNDLTIGIENNSGVIGLNPINNPIAAPYVAANFSIKFYYPPNSTFVVNDASTLWANNTTNGAIFLSKHGNKMDMNAMVKNVGNLDLPAFNVTAKVTGPVPSNAVKASDVKSVGPLATGISQAVNMTNQYSPDTNGTFRFFNLTQYSGDAFLGNDSAIVEVIVVDTSAVKILLSYDNGFHTSTAEGLSWTGGNGGAGIYIVPPYYPCQIDSLRYFIVANPAGSGFISQIMDDDGPGGSGASVLFSSNVDGIDVDTLAWNVVKVVPPVIITDGGFYVAWMMDGDGIALGQDQTAPFSNRTFEVLGTTWAIYRYRETEEVMINAYMKGNFGASIEGYETLNSDFNLYPNPAKDQIRLVVSNLELNMKAELYDVRGVMVRSFLVNGIQTDFNLSGLSAGIYTCKLVSSAGVSVKKFALVH